MELNLYDLLEIYNTKYIDQDYFDEHEITGVTLEDYKILGKYMDISIEHDLRVDPYDLYVKRIYRLSRYNKVDCFLAELKHDEGVTAYVLNVDNIDSKMIFFEKDRQIALCQPIDAHDAQIAEIRLSFAIQYLVDAFAAGESISVYNHFYEATTEAIPEDEKRFLIVEVEANNKRQYADAIEKLRRIKNQFTQRRLVVMSAYEEDYY